MSKLSQPATLCALVLGLSAAVALPAHAAAPVEIADNRCNSQTIDAASARIRDYDRHGPGGAPAALLARYGAIADVISTLEEEQGILTSVCSSDSQRTPLFAQIAATTAWALVLEADIAARLNASCPAAAKALPAMMLADAWLALANVINDQGGSVPVAFGDVVPKVRAGAQAVGLSLPAWAETSQYWRDQTVAKAKAQFATCPSPSPAPTH